MTWAQPITTVFAEGNVPMGLTLQGSDADWRPADPMLLVLRAEQFCVCSQGSTDVVGNRLDQPHSPATEAGAAAALQGVPEATMAVKPRRYLLGVWVEDEPGATYRFLCFCGAHALLLD